MRYVETILGRNEQIIHETRLHWIILVKPTFVTIAAVMIAAVVGQSTPDNAPQAILVYTCSGLLSIVLLISSFIRLWTTEIAVTTRRIIFKKGFVARDTIEINMNKVESIDIQQTVLGRLLNFGTVVVRGTGGGLEPIRNVDGPIDLRNATFDA